MKAELKALFRIVRFFVEIAGSLALGWLVIVSMWAIFGN